MDREPEVTKRWMAYNELMFSKSTPGAWLKRNFFLSERARLIPNEPGTWTDARGKRYETAPNGVTRRMETA